MQVEVTIGPTPKVLSERLKKIMSDIRPAILRSLELTAEDLRADIIRNVSRTRMFGLPASWRTGKLKDEKDGGASISVYSNHPGAALREYGHPNITPGKSMAKSGPNAGMPTKALAIPIGANAKRARPLRPFEMGDDLFPVRSRKGNLLLVKRKGKRGIDPQFVLKRSVSVPPHPYVQPAVDAHADDLTNRIRKDIEKYLAQVA